MSWPSMPTRRLPCARYRKGRNSQLPRRADSLSYPLFLLGRIFFNRLSNHVVQFSLQLARISLFVGRDGAPDQRPRGRIPEIDDERALRVWHPDNSRTQPAPPRRISLRFEVTPCAECVANVKIRSAGSFWRDFAR